MKATNKGRRRVENPPETQAVPTDWQVVTLKHSIPEPEPFPLDPLPDDPAEVERLKAETRRVVEEAWNEYEPEPDEDLHIEPDRAPMSTTQMADRQRADESLSDLGEIEAAVLKRNNVSIGQAAGYFSQIVAAAEMGGASWEARLKAACRKGEK